MEICENCGAKTQRCGTAPDGKKICCAHCMFHPLGCRCKWGEYGVAEDTDWAGLNEFRNDFDDDDDFEQCSDCDGHDACRDFGCAIKHGLGHLVQLPF